MTKRILMANALRYVALGSALAQCDKPHLQKTGKAIRYRAMTIRRQTTIEIDMPPAEAMKYVEGALQRIGARIVARTEDVIQARKRLGFLSNGERLFVELNPLGTRRTRLEVSSENLFATALFDFGANQRNIDRFRKHLDGLIKLTRDLDVQ